ncbi:MAG TPA: calcium-binding protein [Solirubrobacterales bacterium]|nr:calcium-binding protein [Solirubrobacterales bacterium]
MSAGRLRGLLIVAGPVSAGLCLGAVCLAGPLVSAPPAAAQVGGDLCLTADPPPVSAPPERLRFGITPLAAGSAGATQGQPKPEDPAAALRELGRLRPGRRQLLLHLNRMLMSDGEAGILRFAGLVDGYARAGFDSELQVRYHPGAGQEGDMSAWSRYVQRAAQVLGRRPSVKALTITNEVNFPISPNTSDGSYAGALQAIVTGVVAARRELDRIGRPDVELGFSFAWRWLPTSDADFWRRLGALATPEFRRALDYVGLQAYPGLVYPPVSAAASAGDDTVEALTLLRHCYMPQAGLGRGVDLWITENGFATNLGRSEADQDLALRSTLDAIYRYSGALGVTDYRWFNLRDNDSTGTDLFAAVGLLRDDYSEKPAFSTYRSYIDRIGADRPKPRRCDGRIATVVGSSGRDVLRGGRGPDVIATGGGRDVVRSGRGADRICTGAGRDVIRGGPGRDTLVGGAAADRIWGGPGRDRCPGTGERDRVRSCAGRSATHR